MPTYISLLALCCGSTASSDCTNPASLTQLHAVWCACSCFFTCCLIAPPMCTIIRCLNATARRSCGKMHAWSLGWVLQLIGLGRAAGRDHRLCDGQRGLHDKAAAHCGHQRGVRAAGAAVAVRQGGTADGSCPGWDAGCYPGRSPNTPRCVTRYAPQPPQMCCCSLQLTGVQAGALTAPHLLQQSTARTQGCRWRWPGTRDSRSADLHSTVQRSVPTAPIH
jgi:hypothetical protein